MFNRFRRVFTKNRKQDRESLTENEVIDEPMPEIPVSPQEELHFYEEHFGSDPENMESWGKGSTHKLSFDNPLYDPQPQPIEAQRIGATGGEGVDNPLYEPQPHHIQTPRDTHLGGFRLGEYEYSKTFEDDIQHFNSMGVFINCNTNLGVGASGAFVYGGHYQGISEKWDNRRFAVKVFIYQNPNEPRIDIEREKEIMNCLNHKYLVNIHNVVNMGDVRPMSYITMFEDQRDLGPLYQYIKRYPPFNSDQLRAFTYQILEGLRYLHSQGICHGDLHEGNVFLFSDIDHIDLSSLGIGRSAIRRFKVNFTAKLADFGMSVRNQNYDNDMKRIGSGVFARILGKALTQPPRCNFDNSLDERTYLSLIDKIKNSPDVPTLYQTTELKNWFKIK